MRTKTAQTPTQILKGTLYFLTDKYPVEVEILSKNKAIAYGLESKCLDYNNGEWEVIQKRNWRTWILVWNKHINTWSINVNKLARNRGYDFVEGEQIKYEDPSF